MHRSIRRLLLLPFLCLCLSAQAETFRCTQGGKTVFSDTPCAANANRVDDPADRTSRDQRRQAELVNQKNRTQLSELEYRSARDRYQPGSYNVIDSMNSSEPSTYRRRR